MVCLKTSIAVIVVLVINTVHHCSPTITDTPDTDKTPKTEISVTPETEITETSNTEITETLETGKSPETNITETTKTEITESSKKKITETLKTEIVSETPETEITETTKPEIGETSKTGIAETPETEIAETTKTEIIETPETGITETPETGITEIPETEKTPEMKRCEEILEEAKIFSTGPNDGLKNFKHAFQFLTAEYIHRRLGLYEKMPPTQSIVVKNERRMKHAITIDYYTCLVKEANEINLDDNKLPLTFCLKESPIVQAELRIKNGKDIPYDEIFAFCETYVMRLFPGDKIIAEVTSKFYVLKTLYEVWSYDRLNYYNIIQYDLNTVDEDSLEVRSIKLYCVERFAIGYYQQYEATVMKLKLSEGQRNFKSTTTYCREEGKKMIKQINDLTNRVLQKENTKS